MFWDEEEHEYHTGNFQVIWNRRNVQNFCPYHIESTEVIWLKHSTVAASNSKYDTDFAYSTLYMHSVLEIILVYPYCYCVFHLSVFSMAHCFQVAKNIDWRTLLTPQITGAHELELEFWNSKYFSS